MKTLILLITHFFQLTFNQKSKYLLYFGLPVLIMTGAFLLFGISSGSSISAGFVNKDQGTLGKDLAAWLEKATNTRLVQLAEEKTEKEVREGRVLMAIIIPADFSESILNSRKPALRLLSLQGGAAPEFTAADINQFIRSVSLLVKNAGPDRALFDALYSAFRESETSMQVHTVTDARARKEVGAMSIGFLLFFISMQAMLITGILLREKQERTYLRIITAPVQELAYTAANMLAAFFILATEIIFTLGIVVFVFHIDLALPVIPLLLVLLSFSIAVIGVGLLIIAYAGSTLQAALLSGLVITLSCMLGGCFWPLSFMQGWMQKIAVILPQGWAMAAVEKLQQGASLSSVSLTLLLLLSFGALFISVYAFKMKHNRQTGTFL